jgi:hypothetical protein
MCGCNKQIDVFEQIVNLVKDKLDYNQKCDAMLYLAKYTVFYGSEALKSFIYEKASTYTNLKSQIDRFKAEFDRFQERKKKHKTNITVDLTSFEPVTATVNVGRVFDEYDNPF